MRQRQDQKKCGECRRLQTKTEGYTRTFPIVRIGKSCPTQILTEKREWSGTLQVKHWRRSLKCLTTISWRERNRSTLTEQRDKEAESKGKTEYKWAKGKDCNKIFEAIWNWKESKKLKIPTCIIWKRQWNDGRIYSYHINMKGGIIYQEICSVALSRSSGLTLRCESFTRTSNYKPMTIWLKT